MVVDARDAGSSSRPEGRRTTRPATPARSPGRRTAQGALKHTRAFQHVYRRGRWVHSRSLSLGAVDNRLDVSRVGLRTRRGLKGAVVRNRLKRQLRALLRTQELPGKSGFDVVIVIHPKTLPVSSRELQEELTLLCKRTGLLC